MVPLVASINRVINREPYKGAPSAPNAKKIANPAGIHVMSPARSGRFYDGGEKVLPSQTYCTEGRQNLWPYRDARGRAKEVIIDKAGDRCRLVVSGLFGCSS